MTRLSMFRALAAGLALVLLPWLAAGQGTADFAGTWVLDQAQSELPERRRGNTFAIWLPRNVPVPNSLRPWVLEVTNLHRIGSIRNH